MAKVQTRVTRKPVYIAYQRQLENKVKQIVARSCNMVRNTAIQEIAQGVKSGADRGDGFEMENVRHVNVGAGGAHEVLHPRRLHVRRGVARGPEGR